MSIYKLAITCFVPMLFCTPALGEIRLDDVVLTNSYIPSAQEGFGIVRIMQVGLPVMQTTEGFVFEYNPFDAFLKIWEAEIGDVITNETILGVMEIPEFVEGVPQDDNLAPGESGYFGYANQSDWISQGVLVPDAWQVFGWMHLERSADDGVLRVLASAASYGPESTVEEGRYHLSPGIIVGTTQVPEPSSALLGLLAVAGLGLIRRRR